MPEKPVTRVHDMQSSVPLLLDADAGTDRDEAEAAPVECNGEKTPLQLGCGDGQNSRCLGRENPRCRFRDEARFG